MTNSENSTKNPSSLHCESCTSPPLFILHLALLLISHHCTSCPTKFSTYLLLLNYNFTNSPPSRHPSTTTFTPISSPLNNKSTISQPLFHTHSTNLQLTFHFHSNICQLLIRFHSTSLQLTTISTPPTFPHRLSSLNCYSISTPPSPQHFQTIPSIQLFLHSTIPLSPLNQESTSSPT